MAFVSCFCARSPPASRQPLPAGNQQSENALCFVRRRWSQSTTECPNSRSYPRYGVVRSDSRAAKAALDTVTSINQTKVRATANFGRTLDWLEHCGRKLGPLAMDVRFEIPAQIIAMEAVEMRNSCLMRSFGHCCVEPEKDLGC
jgi:hypothetical protein